ncbi:MAG: hypothetical protein GY869_09345, partial [Planctomycetes bacterium]|nr:hypothetical protein [Planctomycetota bacterium]
MKNPKIAILASCLAATLLFAGCNSATTLQTYPGDPLPLEQVAVLVTSPDSCPIYNIDGEYRDLDRQPGAELHLMPGSHVVEVFYQKKAPNNQWKIERTSISYNYKAGQVYT